MAQIAEAVREDLAVLFPGYEDFDPEIPTDDSEGKKPWRIESDDEAEWAAGKIREAYEVVKAAKDRRERILARLTVIDEEVAAAKKNLERTEAFFGGEIRRYLEENRATMRTKSRAFVAGVKVGFRAKGDDYKVYDPKLFIQKAAPEHPELTRTKVEPDATAIKKYLSEHPDEKLPGVQKIGAHEEFYVKVEADE